jgi:hypothetical protein
VISVYHDSSPPMAAHLEMVGGRLDRIMLYAVGAFKLANRYARNEFFRAQTFASLDTPSTIRMLWASLAPPTISGELAKPVRSQPLRYLYRDQ